ncbi:MAG TPA: tetratricopeptide repeat protein [Planctomycetaceae bacterium]
MASMSQALAFAVQHHQAGRLSIAEPIYRQILAQQPDQPDALHYLGLIAHQTGRQQEAIDCIERAIRLHGTQPAYHNNLGGAFRALAKLNEAAACYERAIQLQPDFVEAYRNLGAVRDDQGRLDEAIACYRRALQMRPNDPDLHNSLAVARIHDGRLEEAVDSCRRALALRPDFAEAHNNLGNARSRQGRLDEAVECFQRALAAKPDYVEALNNLGIAYTALKSPQEAAPCFQKALELSPTSAAAQFSLGKQFQEVGDFDGAERCWRDALRHDPGHVYALAELAMLRGSSLPAEDLVTLRQALEASSLNSSQRSALHFGLAHVLDARGDFVSAAEHLLHANSVKMQDQQERGQSYEPAEHETFVTALMEQFSASYFARVTGFGADSERPVFVFGLPRSGTTLIEQILAGHSQIFGAGELELANAAFESLPQWTASGLSAVESVGRLDQPTISRIFRQYLERLSALDSRALRVVDKAPGNDLYLGLLVTLFPKARFIHCRRDLRDVAVSCWMTDFRYLKWANDYGHIASRIGASQRLMEHWRRVLPAPLIEVDYESTVADLEGTARRLIDRCGLDWEPACLAFHERRHPVRTASVSQVRKPIYQQSVGRWKNYEKALARLFSEIERIGAADG